MINTLVAKFLLLVYFATTASGLCLDFKVTKVYGATDYQQKGNHKSFNTAFNIEYRVHLHEHPQKLWLLYLGGKITTDLDHLGGEVKQNFFTTIGIDFW